MGVCKVLLQDRMDLNRLGRLFGGGFANWILIILNEHLLGRNVWKIFLLLDAAEWKAYMILSFVYYKNIPVYY